MQNFEIERKFLIKKPEESLLSSLPQIQVAEIVQSYTSSGARLRKWTEKGKITYIKTVKTHITHITRIEVENEITEEEYKQLLKTEQSRLTKVRYRYPYKGKLIEIDIYPFWEDRAILEVELVSEDEEFSIPEFIRIIKEVSHDKAYRNYSLSKIIPEEENF